MSTEPGDLKQISNFFNIFIYFIYFIYSLFTVDKFTTKNRYNTVY